MLRENFRDKLRLLRLFLRKDILPLLKQRFDSLIWKICISENGKRRGRLLLFAGKLVEHFQRLFVVAAVAVKLYPVAVERGYSAGFQQNVVNVVAAKPKQPQLLRGERRFVLKNAAGKQVVDIRDTKPAVKRGNHILLVLCQDTKRHRLVSGNLILRHGAVFLHNPELKRQRHLKRVVRNHSVSVCLKHTAHCHTSRETAFFFTAFQPDSIILAQTAALINSKRGNNFIFFLMLDILNKMNFADLVNIHKNAFLGSKFM